jgi:hypothetical protein
MYLYLFTHILQFWLSCLDPLVYLLPLYYLAFQSFDYEPDLVKVIIPETYLAHRIRYVCVYYYVHLCWCINSSPPPLLLGIIHPVVNVIWLSIQLTMSVPDEDVAKQIL